MGGQIDFLSIVILAALALFIITRLVSILGRRTGSERARPTPLGHADKFERVGGQDNVIQLPGRGSGAEEPLETAITDVAPEGSPLAQALTEIQIADRTFDPGQFVEGARGAYEMIVEAFSAGDKSALKPLLGAEVFDGFASVIDARAAAGQTVETTFIGFEEARIVDAALESRTAEVTMRFVSEIVRCVKNENGAIIEGDPNAVNRVVDIWTFARDTRSADPNWHLVGTASE